MNAYTHAVKCKVQKHHSVWDCLKATWSVNISLITSHISSRVFDSWTLSHLLLCPLFLPFILSFTHFSTSLPPPPYHSNPKVPQRWHQMAAPSENKTPLCVCVYSISCERECVCLCNICWAQWKTLMFVGEGVINKYHKWLLCVPIFPRRRVENRASVSAEVLQGWYRNLLRATDQVRFWLLWRLTTLVYSVRLCKPPQSLCSEMHNANYVPVSISIIAVAQVTYDPEVCDWKSAVFES